ncbi:hypothetical protein B6U66_01335 [Candidatus Bathyarchaeota archaeon ex4484_135]|nr:MAG: hypothetical protein B6U66_01335 [Candidatus Bathyarchaeota archaeon ex4484_135]
MEGWRKTRRSRRTGGKRLVTCPRCGFRFDLSYARTFACMGCPSLVQCSMVKCPRCGHEFPSPYVR